MSAVYRCAVGDRRIVWLGIAGWSLLLGAQLLQAVRGEPAYSLGVLVLLAGLAVSLSVALAFRALQRPATRSWRNR